MTASFSSRERALFSPTVPQAMRPDTPSATSAAATLRVASMSSEKSARNCVVIAGNTPAYAGFFAIVALPEG